mmetsp:Transcript_29563/g.28765  ORF Transcript_29563/g.28765 Transcript_29563/m.28765 type:complete len:117 (-) Transcript_29563:1060-1410(-)
MNYLVSEIFGKPSCNPSKTFGRSPSHHIVVILERIQQKLNDELKLFEVNIIIFFFFLFLFILHLLVLLDGTFTLFLLTHLQVVSQRPEPSLVPPLGYLWLQKYATNPLRQVRLVFS